MSAPRLLSSVVLPSLTTPKVKGLFYDFLAVKSACRLSSVPLSQVIETLPKSRYFQMLFTFLDYCAFLRPTD